MWILAISIVTSHEGSLQLTRKRSKNISCNPVLFLGEREGGDYYTYVGAMNNVPIVAM